MLNKINVYVLFQILKSFTLVFFIFLSISWLLQLTRLFSLTNLIQINFINILQLSVYLIPNILTVIIPFILIFGILLCFIKLSKDREIIAVYSLGMHLKPFRYSLTFFILLVVIFQIFLNTYIAPKIYEAYKLKEFDLRNTINLDKMILSNFIKINNNTTIDFKKENNLYLDILINFNDEKENIIYAKNGLIDNDNDKFIFELKNGFKLSLDQNNNNIEKLEFDNYILRINKNNTIKFDNYDKNTLTIFDDLSESNYFNIISKFSDVIISICIIYFFYKNNVMKVNFSLKNNIFFILYSIFLLIMNQTIKNSEIDIIFYLILVVILIISVLIISNFNKFNE